MIVWLATACNDDVSAPVDGEFCVHVLAWYSSLFDLPPEHALKHLQATGTAAFGPVSYLAWRMVLRPGWALAIGVLAILPIIDPYKPYPNRSRRREPPQPVSGYPRRSGRAH